MKVGKEPQAEEGGVSWSPARNQPAPSLSASGTLVRLLTCRLKVGCGDVSAIESGSVSYSSRNSYIC